MSKRKAENWDLFLANRGSAIRQKVKSALPIPEIFTKTSAKRAFAVTEKLQLQYLTPKAKPDRGIPACEDCFQEHFECIGAHFADAAGKPNIYCQLHARRRGMLQATDRGLIFLRTQTPSIQAQFKSTYIGQNLFQITNGQKTFLVNHLGRLIIKPPAVKPYGVVHACITCFQKGFSTKGRYPSKSRKLWFCFKHGQEFGDVLGEARCVMCPKTSARYAIFQDLDGRHKKVCTVHAKELGTYKRRLPCEMCPKGSELSGQWPNQNGEINKLCSRHAKEVNTYAKRRPCVMCSTETVAGWPDENGRPCKLCTKHAKKVGTYFIRTPCEKCPESSKVSGKWPNEAGLPYRLCFEHAQQAGTYFLLAPCEACSPENKLSAQFPNKNGQLHRLCTKHAKAAETYFVPEPCEDCPADSKIIAKFPNKQGKPRSLCATHAVMRGTIPKSTFGTSKMACRCIDRLELDLGCKLQHVHLRPNAIAIGTEYKIPGTRYRVDGYDATSHTAYEFMGNVFHGFPEGHKRFAEFKTEYDQTFARFEKIQRLQPELTIKYVWENEYKQTELKRNPVDLASVVHRFKKIN